MNIIIDPEQLEEYQKKYTVLELDTFRIVPENKQVKAYCMVETIPIGELHLTQSNKNLHNGLMESYRNRNWNYCNEALDHLVGCWNKELDSFYEDIRNRINLYTENEPGDSWDGVIEKHTA
jgi:hypothetical protein|tara:strand:+ start:1494 stop:1856 length:363 start_codon:yes stop_codon:yes gene_type:complete